MAAIAALAAAQRGGAAAAWRAARRSGTALQTLCLPAADAAHAASPWSTGAARGTCTGAAGAMQQQHSWPQREPPRGSSWRPHGDGAPLCLRLYSSSSGSSDREEARPGSSPSSPSSSGATPPRRHGRAPAAVAALQAAGWSRREVLSVPNALSLARLLSGPLIASWIMDAQWAWALPALALSGASDWADGWAARRFNQPSVIGSYLDPLADKVLICSVVGALGWSGVLPPAVVGIIVGRDVVLVTGAFVVRARSLGWRWPGAAEFFRVAPGGGGGTPEAKPGGESAAGGAVGGAAGLPARGAATAEAAADGGGGAGAGGAAPAPLVKPLLISKVNTGFQLGLVGACITHSWLGWPSDALVWWGSVTTAGTTLASCVAYLAAYRQGRVLAAPLPGGGVGGGAPGPPR